MVLLSFHYMRYFIRVDNRGLQIPLIYRTCYSIYHSEPGSWVWVDK